MKKNIILLLSLFCYVLGAAAEDKVYISDFSIKAGETKRIALCFDTEATDITRLTGTVTMPQGLTVQNQAASGYTWMSGNAVHTGGALVSYNPSTGGVMITGATFNAGTGAVGYIDVMATSELAATSTITVTGFKVKKSDGTEADVPSVNCTVTLGEGQGEGGQQGGEESDELTFAFSPSSLTLTKGQTATVDVTMANGMSLTGMQATLTAANGLTVTGVTQGSRVVGTFNYKSDTGNLMSLGSISGNDGTVFTVTLKADDDFSGSTSLAATGLKVTTASAKSISAADITLPVTVVGPITLTLSEENVTLLAGQSAVVNVMISTGFELTGFQATLTLPENVTAEMSNKISDYYLSYKPSTGKILYMGGLAGESIPAGDNTLLFTLTLTAGDDFAAGGEMTLTNIATTTSAAQSIGVPDVTLPIELYGTTAIKDALGVSSAAVIYDLNGRKLQSAPTMKGIYIQNGRKVVIK